MDKTELKKCLDFVSKTTDTIILETENKKNDIDEWFKNAMKIKEVRRKLQTESQLKNAQLKKDVNELKKEYEELEKVVSEEEAKAKVVKESLDNRMTELSLAQQDYRKQKELSEAALRKRELSSEDRKLMNEAKPKLDLYTELTNIKWDYTVPESEAARGYVRNKQTGRCHSFSFRCDQYDVDELRELLWEQVERATLACGPEDKENVPAN